MTGAVALTSGEPAGVGLELSLLAWDTLRGESPFFLIADHNHVSALHSDIPTVAISSPPEASAAFETGLPVLHHPFSEENRLGKPSRANAADVIDVIECAVDLVQSGGASAVCTNPIHKKALKEGAGFAFPGHTEFLAALGNVPRPVMMLCGADLKVVPVTIHVALNNVAPMLSATLLENTIRVTCDSLKSDFRLSSPRIAVAGLNPHAGEGGTMGREEIDVIEPVIEKMRSEGMDIAGPHSADTMFHAEARAKYDVAIAMYHDQALIPLKTLNFYDGINVTLGLPFVRTSPDHGTALDIAGKGIAKPESLIAALRQASRMAESRTRSK